MKKFLVSVLAIAGLVACHNEEAVRMPEHNQAIAFADAFVGNSTRAAEDPSTTTASINAFDVWSWMDNDKGGVVLTDENVTKNGNDWSYTNVQYWTPDHLFHFVAVAPMDSAYWTYDYANDKIEFTNENGTEDLLFDYVEVDTDGKTINSVYDSVNVEFAHLLAKTKFTFVNGFATDNMYVEVSNIKMTAPKTATFAVNGEQWGDVDGNITLAYGNVAHTSFGKNNESAYERFTIPASKEQEYVVTYTITVYRGTVKDYEVKKTSTIRGVEFEKGKAYNFVAEISPETLDMQAIEFTVEVEEWDTPINDVSVVEKELRYKAQYGGEYTITEDLVLSEPLNVVADMVINMEGQSLTGSINVADGVSLTVNGGDIVNEDKSVSGIVSNGDLTLNDVNVTSARHALRIESGNVVIKGGVYTVDPISKSTLHALNVGDDNTVAHVTINGGTFIGPKGTVADSGSAVNVRAGSTVVINGGDFSGGKTKTLANGGTLTINGGTFDQDPTAYVADGLEVTKIGDRYYVAADYLVADAAGLQKALDANVTSDIRFIADIVAAEPIVAKQVEGVNFVVNGDGYKFDGTFAICGNARSNGAETITLKNINFETASTFAAFVNFDNEFKAAGHNYNYAHNITVEDCTFTAGADVVAVRGNQAYDIVVKNCVATGVHSLAQVTSSTNVTFENVKVNALRGINLGNSITGVANFTNCEINATKEDGYGIRVDAAVSGAVMNVSGSTIAAYNPIHLRNSVAGFEFNIASTTLNPTGSCVYHIYVTGTMPKVTGVDYNEWLVYPKNVVSTAAQLNAALSDNEVSTILLDKGEFGTIVAKSNKTIIGTEGAKVDAVVLNGAKNLTLKNIVFDAAKAIMSCDGKGTNKQYANIVTGDKNHKPIVGALNLVIDGCTFAGTFVNGGAAIAFTDQNRSSGGSGNVTIKNCTFETKNSYYNIYGHYFGNGTNGYGDFVIENNIFNSQFAGGGPVYLGRYASSTPVEVKNNVFYSYASLEDAVYVQDHSNYGVSIDAENNTFVK